MIRHSMRSVLQFGFLLVAGLSPAAQAAVVFLSLEDRGLGFHSGDTSTPRTALDFLPGEGLLWLVPGSFVSSTSWLVSQGPVRIATTVSPPPNIGGPVSAVDAHELFGPSLQSPREWYAGEPVFENGQPVPGDRFHVLYDGTFSPIQSEFFKEEAYIGLEFEINGQLHYGWLSVELAPGEHPLNSRPTASRITGFAYETQPGVPITAGAVPEPVVPLLVTMGCGALCLRRRRSIHSRDGSSPPSPTFHEK